MAKPKAATATPPSKTSDKKYPAIKFKLAGQMVVARDRRPDAVRYEEEFVIPARYKNEALRVALRCLLPHRLAKKHDNFRHARTYEIKSALTAMEDSGLELFKKDLYDMDAEEIRCYALFIGLTSPEYRMIDGKKRLIRTLDALEIIKTTPIDLDLKDKVEKFLKEGAKAAPVAAPVETSESEEEEEEETDAEETAGEAGKPKENWENLDKD